MKNNKTDNDDPGVEITEQPTGEYLALGDNSNAATPHSAEPSGTARAPAAKQTQSVKAAFWLTHLENEVTRLHAKWQSIDAEFKTREARIAELHAEIASREAAIRRLSADLERDAAALKAADERLASKDGEITSLNDNRRASEERIAALVTELADAQIAHKATLQEIEHAKAETARLNDAIRREQNATAAMNQLNEQLLAEQRRLQTALQDLEIYINGRHDRWSELNAELAKYKDALLGMDKTVKARDAAIAHHDEEKRHLAARILDLERQSAELVGRRKEREAAYDELQTQLSAHFEQTEQLRADYANRMRETEQAVKKAVDGQRNIESLEFSLKRRDESIEALNAELELGKSVVSDLSATREKLLKRVEELEHSVAERSLHVQNFRDDLRMSHDQLHLVQQQLSERTMQLASSQEALDQKSRHAERLNNDLTVTHKDAARMRAELERLEAHAGEIGQLRSEAVAEAEQLKAELAAQQELIATLETELRAKQATADLLERNVDRITDLGASLAALDKQMNGDDEEPQAEVSSLHLADFVTTLAADARLTAAAHETQNEDEGELLPMDLLLDDDDLDEDVVDVGQRTAIDAARKLVITIGGEEFDYPIVSEIMTIGRGHGSDIRIASHYVSRVHAKIRTNGVATIIEDAGSKNGILVNSERVERRVLHHGDVVGLGGDLNLRFVDAMH